MRKRGASALLLSALVSIGLIVVPATVASAETPAERCARETSAYNSGWAATWAASHPGNPGPAPSPPVPYVCVDPGTVPTATTAPPTTTQGLPTAQSPGGGPNVGANAPTNFPTYNGTPIVPVPGSPQPAAPPQTEVENPAGLTVPTTTGPVRPTVPFSDLGRADAKAGGLPPYAACGSSSERKQIGEYTVQGGRRAYMVCGNRDYGFEHIKGRHMQDWANKGMITGDKWMDLMDYSIEATLLHPEASSQRDGKTCYARKIWMYDKRNGEMTGNFFWSNVIVKDSNGDIITAYPTSGAHRCM